MFKFLVSLTLICAFGAIVVDSADYEKLMADAKACQKETGATDYDFYDMSRRLAITREGKCLRSCIMKKKGEMDSNGKYVKEVFINEVAKHYNEEKKKYVNEILDACSDIQVSDDHCEAAAEYEKKKLRS